MMQKQKLSKTTGKTILVFSDGTGQVGGIRPDQRLSNVYKLYRATRSGPDSEISPNEQIAFYDPGLGAQVGEGSFINRIRRLLSAGVGMGIDENVIDCYTFIVSTYEPGDKVILVGFSRGAYTVRSVANVMNLCGVPTRTADGHSVPRYGPTARKIAIDAVQYVYNHGAGKKRDAYESEREEKADRFRDKYGSQGFGADGEGQGNVQPHFIGVFDTVAALNIALLQRVFLGFTFALVCLLVVSVLWWHPIFTWVLLASVLYLGFWLVRSKAKQFKYFFKDPKEKAQLWNPLHWPKLWKHGHFATWKEEHEDRFLDNLVPFARDAMSIDENRTKFPRVGWGHSDDMKRNAGRSPEWFKQVWFSGNHSDIGGSYPEAESRLSDISLQWMITEMTACIPGLQWRSRALYAYPNALGLQHDEVRASLDKVPKWFWGRFAWSETARFVPKNAPLHSSVLDRLDAEAVPILGDIKPYRPNSLKKHKECSRFFKDEGT